MCILLYACVQVPIDARGVRVTDNCELPVWVIGTEFMSSAVVYALKLYDPFLQPPNILLIYIKLWSLSMNYLISNPKMQPRGFKG